MKHVFLFIITISFIIVQSCSKNDLSDSALLSSSDVIPLHEALVSLEMRMMQLNMLRTKSGEGRRYKVDDIFFVADKYTTTKSGSSDDETRLYVVNFTNDNGYAVLAAKKSIGMDVVCITEKGSLSQNLFAEARCLLSGDAHITKGGDDGQYPSPLDSLFIPSLILSGTDSPNQQVINDPDLPIDGGGGGGAPAFAGPFLMTKWDQSVSPFNSEIVGDVGCSVVALAQIMAYEEYPSVIQMEDGSYGYWSDMKTVQTYPNISSPGTSAGQSQVAKLMKLLRSPSYCNVTQNGALDIFVMSSLIQLGYPNVQIHNSLNNFSTLHSNVIMQLMCNKPVYTSGLKPSSSEGHAWVIDGFAITYYHINWGWSGAGDGYYNSGVFNTDQRQFIDSIDPGTTTSSSHLYSYYYNIITYDKPTL